MTEVVHEEAPENPPAIPNETVTAPAKVMRIGSMIKQLLDEVHSMTMDGPARERLAEIYERSIVELTEALSPDLAEELRMLSNFQLGSHPLLQSLLLLLQCQTLPSVCGRLIFDVVEVLDLLKHRTYQYLHEYWIEHQPSINTSYLVIYNVAK